MPRKQTVWLLAGNAFGAQQDNPNFVVTPRLRQNPGVVGNGRVVLQLLVVAAIQFGNPVPSFVLKIPGDSVMHV